MDWMDDALSVLKRVAPAIATVLGGPAAGLAVQAIGVALGQDMPDKEAALKAVAGATPGPARRQCKKWFGCRRI